MCLQAIEPNEIFIYIAVNTTMQQCPYSEADSRLASQISRCYGTRKFVFVFTEPATAPCPEPDYSNPP